MKLSILIPTHNRPKLFTRCLESVLQQITPDVEIIVNNDSQDISEINHPQVKYFYNKFDSLCDVYKFLLRQAQGVYVYYLEDDDYLVGDFLEQQLNADLVVGNYCPKYQTPDMLSFMTMYSDATMTSDEFIRNLNHEHLQLSQHIFKRKHILDFEFPGDSNVHNDVKLTLHAASKASSIKTNNKVFFFQTIDGGDNISFKTIKSCGKPELENIYFDWHLTNWCNFKCSYCPVLDVITNDFSVDDHAPYRMVLARLKNVETSFNVCLTGGEPTLHPNILEILEELSKIEYSQDIAMFTNMSRPLPFYEKIRAIGSNKIVVFASYHPEFVTDKFTQRCLDVNQIDGLRFSVHVSLHDDPKYWASTTAFLNTMRANNVSCKPLLLAPNKHFDPNYTDEFYAVFHPYLESTEEEEFFPSIDVEYTDGTRTKLKSYDIQIQKLNKFKGYQCTPASFTIGIDGHIENTCTRRQAPLLMNNKNLIVKELCPREICASKRLLEFYKEKV